MALQTTPSWRISLQKNRNLSLPLGLPERRRDQSQSVHICGPGARFIRLHSPLETAQQRHEGVGGPLRPCHPSLCPRRHHSKLDLPSLSRFPHRIRKSDHSHISYTCPTKHPGFLHRCHQGDYHHHVQPTRERINWIVMSLRGTASTGQRAFSTRSGTPKTTRLDYSFSRNSFWPNHAFGGDAIP